MDIFLGDLKVGVEVKMRQILVVVRVTQGTEVCQRVSECHAKIKQYILPMW